MTTDERWNDRAAGWRAKGLVSGRIDDPRTMEEDLAKLLQQTDAEARRAALEEALNILGAHATVYGFDVQAQYEIEALEALIEPAKPAESEKP